MTIEPPRDVPGQEGQTPGHIKNVGFVAYEADFPGTDQRRRNAIKLGRMPAPDIGVETLNLSFGHRPGPVGVPLHRGQDSSSAWVSQIQCGSSAAMAE